MPAGLYETLLAQYRHLRDDTVLLYTGCNPGDPKLCSFAAAGDRFSIPRVLLFVRLSLMEEERFLSQSMGG